MLETTADNPVKGSKPRTDAHFRFLDLPYELRSKIIKYAIRSTYSTHELEAWQKLRYNGYRTGREIEPKDFTISSTGLKCHSMTSFSFACVNKQLRHEALNIIYRNATVCVHVHIPRYGPFSTIPKDISKTYRILCGYSMLLELARDITFIVDPQPVRSQTLEHKLCSALDAIFGYNRNILWGLFFLLCIILPLAYVAQLAGRLSGIMPFQGKRHSDLQALIDLLVQAPGSDAHLKLIIYLEDLHLQDLAIVLRLLNLRWGPTTLEEVWFAWHYSYEMVRQYTKEEYDKHYKNLVMTAAEQAGCLEILGIPAEFDVEETHREDVRGTQHVGRSRRTWIENNNVEVVIE
ncbi:hypothetical protein N7474_005544 [Penicillium riverlandense]|uniref:uncharacterized protein n=1 Tax=Penicillium riverlandense TaxID=1903569 RepID=UPI0025475575|nr:uncharacterized protein N7474_005544 [Penicillium riverlandense]KAJ5819953.1 hypothetical protein N7474_005544 [Penicillium riverlandense]